MKKSERVRVTAYLPPDADEKIESVMAITGFTKSKVVQLATIAGLDAVRLALDPAYKRLFEVMNAQTTTASTKSTD